MRVVAGELGGRKLISPPSRSRAVRPTSDRARESLFSILGDLTDLSVLDLFCGTGALGIEAVSRGADSAVLVDTDPAIARRNVEALTVGRRCEVVRSDAIRYLKGTEVRFGLILCDPPYRLAGPVAPALSEHLPPHVARFGRLVVESSAREPLELELRRLDLEAERRIGEALIRVYRRS
ncbi:MAG TPA: RsmD family RNA methyltransferase [Solirubrobacterales bacterium]|nr:RsmD family RNA methyltransferase [Solirubrobacterales bacterium]